jgi:hypothetical protein
MGVKGDVMASRAARFKTADITRAYRALSTAGMAIGRVEIDPNTGRMVFVPEVATSADGTNEWDQDLWRTPAK